MEIGVIGGSKIGSPTPLGIPPPWEGVFGGPGGVKNHEKSYIYNPILGGAIAHASPRYLKKGGKTAPWSPFFALF